MKRRWSLYVINTGRLTQAKSYDDALEQAAQVPLGYTWRVQLRIGANDPVIVRQGFGTKAA